MINADLCHDVLVKNIIPKYTFNKNNDFDVWKKNLRRAFIKISGIDVISKNVGDENFEIIYEEQKAGYRIIRFEFDSNIGERVPCLLVVPDGANKNTPIGICLQGHTPGFHNAIGVIKTEKDASLQPRYSFALQAVKNGYIALCVEHKGMGERQPQTELKGGTMYCRYASMRAIMLGRTLQGERIWDVSRAIDQLRHFDFCSKKKIFVMGTSGGGTLAFYSAVYDKRIKLCVPSCSFCPYKESIMDILHCNCNYMPNAYLNFDMQDLTGLIAPRPLAIVTGEKDDIFPLNGVKRGVKIAKEIYAHYKKEDNVSLTVTPKDHYFCEDIVWNVINNEIKKLGW